MAAALEAGAGAAYARLAARMRGMGRADLAGPLEGLAQDAHQRSGPAPDQAPPPDGLPFFEDEGMAETAPELASGYGVFGMAVRNAQRAFAYWSYVAAHSSSDDVRRAAEEMASAALARAAGLRRERRRAFHAERTAGAGAPAWTLAGSPLDVPPLLKHMRAEATASGRPTAELLLDGYLDLAETLPTQNARAAAQGYAEELLDALLDIAG